MAAASAAPPRLFLIDSFGFIFRAYHARARSGAPPMRTAAGIPTEAVYIFHNMVKKLVASHRPEYIAAVFESFGPTFRDQEFPGYKANRAEPPPDLLEQIPWVRRLLEAMRIAVVEFDGYEADDVIGTLAGRAAAAGFDVTIVSSDKDMLQLVTDRVRMLNPMKDDALYGPAEVNEFMGVPPQLVRDLLALKGDAVDNIPGAPGIGDKGARDLLLRFGGLDSLLERAAEVERKMYRESLQNHRDQILLSRRLATIETSVPVPLELEALAAAPSGDAEALREIYTTLEFSTALREIGSAAASGEPASAPPRDFETLPDAAALNAYLDSPEPVALALVGGVAGLSRQPGEGRTLPENRLGELASWLAGPAPKLAHDAKALGAALRARGLEAEGFAGDTLLLGFLLTADPGGCAIEELASRYLGRSLGANAAERAEATRALAASLEAEVDRRKLDSVYREIDLPLIPVLDRMERTGIRVDPVQLATLSRRMDEEIDRLARQIHALAGREFNINSPQQLGRVLFEEMGITPPYRPGKGRAPSTAADVLEALVEEHPIAAQVLEYRQLAKLKGTYADTLPALIHPETGRVHTTFNPAGAATGRLSSNNPNLQNIPVRTALGREIRAAFVPEPGWTLVVADYSQIELRLLAHMSRDPVLTDAFQRNEDIHTRTAAEVMGVPPLMVTPEMRRSAKAVNFGIIYGQTAFGLAQQTGVTRKEAEAYIRLYFERYAGVRRFIDRTVAEVRKTGIARTLHGRERPIPGIDSRNPNERGFAERTAVNTPLQGTAADLIKIAMIRLQRRLTEEGWRSRMLLQVHDELVFEAPPEETVNLARMAKQEMERVYTLTVPLLADVGRGPNWRDAKS
ncbi:MAG: DNA polymerase I [Acidobacteria bacterium]|nr:DNA polymerase I [Acidobacteriota bacterium]